MTCGRSWLKKPLPPGDSLSGSPTTSCAYGGYQPERVPTVLNRLHYRGLVRHSGLLDRRPRYYAWKITLTAAALALGWAAFAAIGNSWWQLADAVFLAAVFAQVGFLGHDAGHSQVFRSRRANTVLGVACGNLGTGISYDWWAGKHNRHHAHPNTEGADPDIMISVLAFSAARASAGRGVQRLIFRYQAYLLVPMLFLEAVSLHASSIRTVTGPGCRHRAW